MTTNVVRYKAQGHRWIESQAKTLGLGPVQTALGATERARQSYQEAIPIATNGCMATEIVAQVRLAALEATEGHVAKAKEHLSRCEAIILHGNGWQGHAGKMDVARAAVAVAEGDLARADDLFARAIDNFREFTLPFEEAAALQMWGGALAESDPKRATERLDAAIDIYTSREAGKGWIDRALHERHRLP
jgi:tetratricopeptide (TPR) repeat protein